MLDTAIGFGVLLLLDPISELHAKIELVKNAHYAFVLRLLSFGISQMTVVAQPLVGGYSNGI